MTDRVHEVAAYDEAASLVDRVAAFVAASLAEDVPVFRGTFGVSHGQQAVQIEERVARRKAKSPDALMLGRK